MQQKKCKGRYWYFIDNIKIKEKQKPKILLWLALPVNHKGQGVKIESISPEPTEIIQDEINGNQVAFWKISHSTGKEKLYFYYDFELTYSEVRTEIDTSKIEPYQRDSKEYLRYTKSEPWIEITPEIKEKAKEIIDKETNPYFRARRIFDWVVENMTYEYPDIKHRGASKSFDRMKGDCGEFSFVFMALCRAAGIPSRSVTCIWFKGGGHQWVEILIPPYGWIPIDTSGAQYIKNGLKGQENEAQIQKFMDMIGIADKNPNYLFGNLYPNRLMVFIGNNAEIVSKKAGIKRVFRFMQPGGDTAYPSGIEMRGLGKGIVKGGFFVFGNKRADKDFVLAYAEKELAPSYLNAGILDKAERGFLEQIKERPDDSGVLVYLGQIYMNTRRYERAIEFLKKSLDVKGGGSVSSVTQVWAHNLLGNCYDIKGMRESAVREYKKVIEAGIDYQGSLGYAKRYIIKQFVKTTK